MSTHRIRGIVAVLLLASLAGGCESLGLGTKKPVPPCPPVLVLKNAESLTHYGPGPGRDITDVDFRSRIVDFRGTCDYNDKRTQVDIALNVMFDVRRGPANRGGKAAFDYFVAIPKFYPAPQGKKTFPLSVAFVGNDTRRQVTDQVHLKIPLAAKARLDDYAIYLGFQLTPEQLRENKRRGGP